MRRFAAAFVALTLQAVASPCFAQSASSDAAAQKFFEEGRTLMAARSYAAACEKFDASDKLSPAGGTILNLADCYEKAGKTASAWAKYNEAADRATVAHRTDAEKFARDHARALAGKLSYLRVVVSPGASTTSGLVIQLDGAAVDRQAWSTPLPVDPGAHKIAASAPGKKNQLASADVSGDGVTATVTVSDLEDDPSAAPAVAAPKSIDEPPPEDADSSKGSTQRILGLGVAAVGVVGLGVGTVFGVIAKNKHDQVVTGCPNDQCTDGSLVQTNDDAKSAAGVSTVAFIAGGVLAVGGVVLYLTAPKSNRASAIRVTPQVGLASGRLVLEGSF